MNVRMYACMCVCVYMHLAGISHCEGAMFCYNDSAEDLALRGPGHDANDLAGTSHSEGQNLAPQVA